MKTLNRSLTALVLVVLFAGLGLMGCGEEESNGALAPGSLSVPALQGTWDMNLAETHPEIFVMTGGLIRTVADTSWAYMVIGPDSIAGYVKLKESDRVYTNSSRYEIIDGRYLHLFNVAQGWEDTFEAVLRLSYPLL